MDLLQARVTLAKKWFDGNGERNVRPVYFSPFTFKCSISITLFVKEIEG
jgi:hypothetical protein